MGRALFESSERARRVFLRADEILGFSLSRLCFEGPDSELLRTENTQPALLTTSIAALETLKEAAPDLKSPAFVLGHSLGEYSALVAAQVLSFDDALRIVRIRGLAMTEAVPSGVGGMAAVMGGDEAKIKALCADALEAGKALGKTDEVLAPANYNAPGQIVIAGHREAVERASELAKERALKAIVLKVSGPFHSKLMGSAREKVRAALREVQLQDATLPVVANVDAAPHRDAGEFRDLLERQVDSAVLFEQSVQAVVAQGVTHALEIGSGKVLSGLLKRIDKSVAVQAMGSPDDLQQVLSFLGHSPG